MKKFLSLLVLSGILLFPGNGFAAPAKPITLPGPRETIGPSPVTALEKRRAIEDINALIIDSYRTRFDKILVELYKSIAISTKDDIAAQIQILTKVRSDLDDKLDALSDASVSENRKQILLGVYFYLKSEIEMKIRELQGK